MQELETTVFLSAENRARRLSECALGVSAFYSLLLCNALHEFIHVTSSQNIGLLKPAIFVTYLPECEGFVQMTYMGCS